MVAIQTQLTGWKLECATYIYIFCQYGIIIYEFNIMRSILGKQTQNCHIFNYLTKCMPLFSKNLCAFCSNLKEQRSR